ncbi:hypothetical protein GGR52DRAFT_561863 [Hypoxylon sp. FL1284]|nr:hypothetical protein GGR52DRAFT_561863 [Hypoxylon sp. FL1284]
MALLQRFTQKGWRRAGSINIALALACAIALSICLAVSVSKSGSSLSSTTIIFEGDCNRASNINTILHLLLNLISTGILASSSYFMQIANSPSRQEIDRAHLFFYSLDIGIPSVKNIQFVSNFKKISWSILLLSSLPIHLFFNSMVFQTSFHGSQWHSTIATVAFTQGAEFFPPGASLAPAGAPHPAYEYDSSENIYDPPDGTHGHLPWMFGNSLGEAVPLEQYKLGTSPIMQNITKAARSGSKWAFLDADTCRSEYGQFKPRDTYGDVIIVVESHARSAEGWAREEVFNLSSNLSSLWDSYVPTNIVNTLWYSAHCINTRASLQDISYTSTCDKLLGSRPDSDTGALLRRQSQDWVLAFPRPSELGLPPKQTIAYGYNEGLGDLVVKYCLAEPYERICKVGVSNLLLTVAIICTTLKIFQCCFLLLKLPESSIVTQGDAIESFIITPDPQTVGLGTLDVLDIHRFEAGPRQPWASGQWSIELGSTLTPTIKPRAWVARPRRLLAIIPRNAWGRLYSLLLVSMALLTAFFALSYESTGSGLQGSFGHSDDWLMPSIMLTDSPYLSILLIANIPQLLLSLCYFSYDSIFMRLLAEKEWNSYSVQFHSLRVSHPQGQQRSSYMLQFSYKYSIPLLAISILCHWILSNSLFTLIIEGGFWLGYGDTDAEALHVREGSILSLGYSPQAILALLAIGCILLPLPLFFGFRRPHGKMVAGGCNSLVLSAACHCYESFPENVDQENSDQHAKRIENPRTPNGEDSALLEDEIGGYGQRLQDMAESKLKWGAMPLPDLVAEKLGDDHGLRVMHLGFGNESMGITTPVERNLYI